STLSLSLSLSPPLAGFLILVAVAQESASPDYPEYSDTATPVAHPDDDLLPFPEECREEQYPCTRLYSVHQPLKQCVHALCFYSLRRMYVINKEICMRTVCLQEEKIKADLCRTQYGWPRRYRRSNNGRQRIRCNDVLA
ncbi:microfibrillar-associated protein 5-like, partial [Mustelus asterias]